MTPEEAKKEFNDTLNPTGEYVNFGFNTTTLDGSFTIAQLKKIISLMEKIKETEGE